MVEPMDLARAQTQSRRLDDERSHRVGERLRRVGDEGSRRADDQGSRRVGDPRPPMDRRRSPTATAFRQATNEGFPNEPSPRGRA